MDDKQLLEKIKKSAEQAEIPESLTPKSIQKKIEQQEEKLKKKRRGIPRYGAWVGAAAVLALIFLTGIPELLRQPSLAVEKEETKKKETEKPDMVSTKKPSEKVFAVAHIEDYEQLYQMLKDYDSSQEAVVNYDYGEEIILEDAQEIVYSGEGDKTSSRDCSSTNQQEAAVEEGDLVKTDGTYIYARKENDSLKIVEAATMELKGEIPVSDYQQQEFYVEEGRIQIIGTKTVLEEQEFEIELPNSSGLVEELSEDGLKTEITEEPVMDTVHTRTYAAAVKNVTVMETYDVTDPSSPVLLGTFTQDGRYLTSRKTDGFLYLFTSYMPEPGASSKDKGTYVPKSGEEYVQEGSIYLPLKQGEYHGENFLVAASIDLSRPSKATDRMAVVGGGETFYVSEKNIYAAFSNWEEEVCTNLVRIGYEKGGFTPGASTEIPGWIKDNFSMDEYEGILRIVTTRDAWEETGDTVQSGTYVRSNGLYILDENLKIQGKVEHLAEDEEIKSARFLGETGYFVTYRNMDPLFSVDLSDPKHPKVLGELKITGFSSYLHFYGKNQLLGMGWETDPDTGEEKGMKCAMFDISDPSKVKETDRLILKQVTFCPGLDQYKAILMEPEKNIFGFVFGQDREGRYKSEMSDGGMYEEDFFYGVYAYEKDTGFISLKKIPLSGSKLFPEGADIFMMKNVRGIYIRDTFYLISDRGIQAYDMKEDFAEKELLCW